jgi:hypothetical protein
MDISCIILLYTPFVHCLWVIVMRIVLSVYVLVCVFCVLYCIVYCSTTATGYIPTCS